MCLPDVRSIKDDVVLDEAFFDAHILKPTEEEWYRGINTIVEKQGDVLKLVSGPDYQPSFQKGLYFANVVQLKYGVTKVRYFSVCISKNTFSRTGEKISYSLLHIDF